MNINKPYLQRYLKDADAYNFGIDYLSLIVSNELEFGSFFRLLNTDNSNTAFIDGELFTYTLQKDSKSKMSTIGINITIDDISYYLMKITQNGGCIANKYSIHILGTTCRLIEKGEIPDLYELVHDIFGLNDFSYILDAYIGRLDYKVDIMFKSYRKAPDYKKLISYKDTITKNEYSTKAEIVDSYKRAIQSIQAGKPITDITFIKKSDGEMVTGRSLGKKKNKNVMIRCYDKNIDSIAKGKYALYDDYFQYQSVRRVEAELHEQFIRCGNERYRFDILEELELKARDYFGLSGVSKNKKYFYSSHSLGAINLKYKNQYCSRGYKLHQNKENPLRIQTEYLLNNNKICFETATALLNDTKNYLDEMSQNNVLENSL